MEVAWMKGVVINVDMGCVGCSKVGLVNRARKCITVEKCHCSACSVRGWVWNAGEIF